MSTHTRLDVFVESDSTIKLTDLGDQGVAISINAGEYNEVAALFFDDGEALEDFVSKLTSLAQDMHLDDTYTIPPERHPEGCSCGSPDCPQWQADQTVLPAATASADDNKRYVVATNDGRYKATSGHTEDKSCASRYPLADAQKLATAENAAVIEV